MGHKHSTLHSQLRNQSEGPNCDLVMSRGGSNHSNPTPYLNVKHGPFKRKLSVRNISIRRSFQMGKKSSSKYQHQPLNNEFTKFGGSSVATTNDNLPKASSSNNNNSNNDVNNQISSPGSSSQPMMLTNGNMVPSTSTTTTTTMNNNHHHHHHHHHHHRNSTPALPRSNSVKMHRSSSVAGGEKFVMDRLRKSFRNSFRKKKSDVITESQKPHQWHSDEQAVRAGNCMFPVKYLGCVEVFESRGMQICEDALRRLRNSRRRGVKGQLYVTGDGIRVVDDDTKGLIVDQTIEKVSFCAPDRSHEHGFSYICRDGTTRRWMCHGFHASKDSGERLSHAVGCAFNICLERKQKRDKESVSAIPDANNFTRTGSFRQSSITERLQDPQVAKPAEPIPVKPVHNPHAIARPHATASLLQRQGSLRGGPLNYVSPFKRQLSLRLNADTMTETLKSIEIPTSPNENSTTTTAYDNDLSDLDMIISQTSSDNTTAAQRTQRTQSLDLTAFEKDTTTDVDDILSALSSGEFATKKESNLSIESNNKTPNGGIDNEPMSSIAQMCRQLSQGLTMLSAKTDNDGLWSDSTTIINGGSTKIGAHISPPAALSSTTATNACKNEKTSTNNTNKMNNGTGLSHLVKDTNSLFSFSNIDQWVSNASPNHQSSTSNTTNNSNNVNNNGGSNKNISQQLNTGSLDSGIASGCSLSGKSINTTVPLIPPAVVDQMPQVDAPPPPSSSSPSFISSAKNATKTANSMPQSTTTLNHNGNNIHNPFLSYDGDDMNADHWNHTNSGKEASDSTKNVVNLGKAINDESATVCTSLPFKSTNPFLSQYINDDNDKSIITANSETKSSPTAQLPPKFESFESVFEPALSTMMAVPAEATGSQQLVKAFEVSM